MPLRVVEQGDGGQSGTRQRARLARLLVVYSVDQRDAAFPRRRELRRRNVLVHEGLSPEAALRPFRRGWSRPGDRPSPRRREPVLQPMPSRSSLASETADVTASCRMPVGDSVPTRLSHSSVWLADKAERTASWVSLDTLRPASLACSARSSGRYTLTLAMRIVYAYGCRQSAGEALWFRKPVTLLVPVPNLSP